MEESTKWMIGIGGAALVGWYLYSKYHVSSIVAIPLVATQLPPIVTPVAVQTIPASVVQSNESKAAYDIALTYLTGNDIKHTAPEWNIYRRQYNPAAQIVNATSWGSINVYDYHGLLRMEGKE